MLFYQTSVSNTEFLPLNCGHMAVKEGVLFHISSFKAIYFFLNEKHGNVNTPGTVSLPISKFNHCCLAVCAWATEIHTHTRSHCKVSPQLGGDFCLHSLSRLGVPFFKVKRGLNTSSMSVSHSDLNTCT